MTVVEFTRHDLDAVQAATRALRLVKEAAEDVDRGVDMSDQQVRIDALEELAGRMRLALFGVGVPS